MGSTTVSLDSPHSPFVLPAPRPASASLSHSVKFLNLIIQPLLPLNFFPLPLFFSLVPALQNSLAASLQNYTAQLYFVDEISQGHLRTNLYLLILERKMTLRGHLGKTFLPDLVYNINSLKYFRGFKNTKFYIVHLCTKGP